MEVHFTPEVQAKLEKMATRALAIRLLLLADEIDREARL